MTNTAAAAAASKRVSISPTTPPNSPAVWRPQNSFARMPNSAAPRPTMVIAVPARRRILFYHKHKPYYGFTNFSAHQVMYNRKRYPTSEHLFQSFKVNLQLVLNHTENTDTRIYSSKDTVPISQSTFVPAASDLVQPSTKHVASRRK